MTNLVTKLHKMITSLGFNYKNEFVPEMSVNIIEPNVMIGHQGQRLIRDLVS